MVRSKDDSSANSSGRSRVLAITLMALLSVILIEPAKAQTPCGSIQPRVDRAAPRETVNLPNGCLYRESVIINKPLTLRGGPGVEIRGSEVWSSGWSRSGSFWVKGRIPGLPSRGECKSGTSRCRWPEQVFFDGKPLEQVASNPQSGQFAVNDARQVLLSDNPAGHKVEVSVRSRWVTGKSGGVTVEGFTMKHAANSAQSGAIRNGGFSNWTVRDNHLSYAHGPNITMGQAAGLRVVGNNVHHSGQVGISGHEPSLEVVGNNIHHNNTEDFRTDWAAGGMKVTDAVRLVAANNNVHNNDWTGLWCDQGCNNVTYSNNRVHHNVRRGIHVEISDNIQISSNKVWENGWGVPDSLGDPGILVVASRDVEVSGNILAWNNDGILVVNSQRDKGVGGSDPKYDLVKNVRVHHNTILAKDYPGASSHHALAWIKAYSGGNLYDSAANNRGYDNRYWYATQESSQERYLWVNSLEKIGGFNKTLGEERGRYLSSSEKVRIAATESIPANPEH